MLGTYIDLGGSQNPADVTVVVASVSTAARWEAFIPRWLKLLEPFDTKVFHTTEYVGGLTTGKGRYGRLRNDREARKKFERGLQRTINACVLKSYIEGIPEQTHRELIPQLRAFGALDTDAYYFCLSMCLLRIHEARRIGRLPNERVVAFAENSTDGKRDNRIKRRYDQIREESQSHQLLTDFGPMTVGQKEDPELVGCQAADWIAYGVTQHLIGNLMGRPIGRTQARLAERITKGRLEGVMFFKPGLYKRFVMTFIRHKERIRRGEVPPGPEFIPKQLLSDEEC